MEGHPSGDMSGKSKLHILGEVASRELLRQGWISAAHSPRQADTHVLGTAVVGNPLCMWLENAFHLQREKGTMQLLVAAVGQRPGVAMKIRVFIGTAQSQSVCVEHRRGCKQGTERHILRPGRQGLIAVFGKTTDGKPALEFCTKTDNNGVIRALVSITTTCTRKCNMALQGLQPSLLVVELEHLGSGTVLAWSFIPWCPVLPLDQETMISTESVGVRHGGPRALCAGGSTLALDRHIESMAISHEEKCAWKRSIKEHDKAVNRIRRILDVAAKEGRLIGFSKDQFGQLARHYWDVNSA